MPTDRSIQLTGVPETMLWTLHNRASESMRPDTYLRDPDCIRIYREIDYDYSKNFGKPDGSHPMRSRIFDDVMRPWLAAHPGGSVVELAAGLETQFRRIDDGKVKWYCVDVPEAIVVRRRFLPETERCIYIAQSALDTGWMDKISAERGVFISAQGLLMYFKPEEARRLIVEIVERFPGVEMMFDTIPEWFSKKTLKGFGKTKYYTAPPMPWGIGRGAMEQTFKSWSERVTDVRSWSYGFARGFGRVILTVFSALPGLRSFTPAIVHVKTRAD